MARDRVKSIFKVDLHKSSVGAAAIALAPLARSLKAHFRAQRLGDSYLQRPKEGSGLVLVSRAEEFSRQAPPDLPHGDWANRAVFFGQGIEGGPGEEGDESPGGLTPDEHLHEGAEVLVELVLGCAGGCVLEPNWAQARRAAGRMWTEGAHCFFHVLRREGWYQAGGGRAEVVQVWRVGGAGVLVSQGVGDREAVA